MTCICTYTHTHTHGWSVRTLRTGRARKISEDGNGVLKKKQIFAERARAPIREGVIISSKSKAKTKSPSLKFCTTAVTNLRFTLRQRGFSTCMCVCVCVCVYHVYQVLYDCCDELEVHAATTRIQCMYLCMYICHCIVCMFIYVCVYMHTHMQTFTCQHTHTKEFHCDNAVLAVAFAL
jgi:hypothetical protein